MTAQKRLAIIYTLISIAIWGVAAVVAKATLNEVPPLLFLWYRFGISSIIAIPTFPLILKLLRNKEQSSLALSYSVLSTPIALGLLFLGLDIASVITLSVIQATAPIAIAVAGSFFFREHLSKHAKLGIGIAAVGSILTVFAPSLASNGGTIVGNILLVGYLLTDVGALVILKKALKKRVSPVLLTHLAYVVGFIALTPLIFLKYSHTELFTVVTSLPVSAHLGVLYMAIFSGTIAFTLRAKGQKTLTIYEAGALGYLIPVISTVLAVAVLKEEITILYTIGSVIIIIGVVITEIHRRRGKLKKTSH